MIVLICALDSIGVKLYLRKKMSINISALKIAVINFGLTLFSYCYYIGYRVVDIKAMFGITWNAFFCVIMSVIMAIGMCVVIRFWQIQRSGRSIVKHIVRPKNEIVLILIILSAFVVRIIGINWGAGETFHPDEGKLVRPPISMALDNTFMSDETLYPTQITSKVLSVVFKIWMLLSELVGIETSQLSFVCIARVYIVILSTAIVACIYFIANHLKKNAGIVAAALVAAFPPFVQAAHCVTGDTFVALCICLSILCAFRYMEENRDYMWVFLMSVIAVLAMLDKYHGMVICYVIALIVCIKQIQQKTYNRIVFQGLFAILVVIGCIILIVPNLIMNINEVMDSIFLLTNDYDEGATFIQNVRKYFVWFFAYAGVLTIPFMISGLVYLLREKNVKSLVLTIGFVEYIAICFQNRNYIRWGYPLYLVLFIMVGIGAICIIEKGYLMSNKIIMLIAQGAIILVGINCLAGTILVDVLYTNSQLDTRIVSETWCLENNISQFDCVYDRYTCWYPGGMVARYNRKPHMQLNESIVAVNESLVVNHLGRKYAVSNSQLYRNQLLEENSIPQIAYFKSDYSFSDSGFGAYGSNWKMLEPYNIYCCFRSCIDILKNHIWFGNDIAIYDISMLPAYELVPYIGYEAEQDLHWSNIDSISGGKYTVEVIGDNIEQGELILETEEGEEVGICEVVNGFGQFSLDQHYYQLRIKSKQKYEYLRITLQ